VRLQIACGHNFGFARCAGKIFIRYAHVMHLWGANPKRKKVRPMHLTHKIKEMAATGYILLWLLGIPIPILLLIFLLRGCT
jgi:hypothetical protein